MSEYTPDTSVIHACYLECTDWASYEGKSVSEVSNERDAEFDRWLGKILISEREDERSIIISRLQEEATRLYRTNEKDSAIMADGIRAAARLLGGRVE